MCTFVSASCRKPTQVYVCSSYSQKKRRGKIKDCSDLREPVILCSMMGKYTSKITKSIVDDNQYC